MNNYTVYHLHTDESNPIAGADSITKFKEYISVAQSLGMKGMAFSEHGNIFEYYHKKMAVEEAGMLYIHGEEFYLTESIDEMKRDNYHIVLLARNKEGFYEINELVTKSFRKDGHFYYVPRITMDELEGISDNIILTTACLASPLARGNENFKKKFMDFLCKKTTIKFLEIQHHLVEKQGEYNKFLLDLSQKSGIKLIAGTDTHALNEEQLRGRKMYQKGKGISFPDEDDWDLSFKTYDQLVECYKKQGALPEEVYMEAIQNTNLLLELVEPFTLSKETKYPKIYPDPDKALREKINEGYKENKAIQKYPMKELRKRINQEVEVIQKVGAQDFILLERYLKEWEMKNGIQRGPGRGSVSGSVVAYDLGITSMDSVRFDLNFFRFLNPERVSNADIDTDFSNKDRDRVKEFLLRDKMDLPNIQSSEIITFNTIELKGAIKDIGRALGMTMDETQVICNAVTTEDKKQVISDDWRKKYPELFEYADLVNGTVASIGTHPSGVLISDRNIGKEIGLCSVSTSEYPVSVLNMKELDDLFYVKLDILGLDNIGLIDETCKMVGIPFLTPDNTPLDDENVWKSIVEDTTNIFQWESKVLIALVKLCEPVNTGCRTNA